MNYTNEEIARAAGYDWPFLIDTQDVREGFMPLFTEDPGAVATWLLPVLEKRCMSYGVHKDAHKEVYEDLCEYLDCDHLNGLDSAEKAWILSCGVIYEMQVHERTPVCSFVVTSTTWHECVIEAIMATAEGGK